VSKIYVPTGTIIGFGMYATFFRPPAITKNGCHLFGMTKNEIFKSTIFTMVAIFIFLEFVSIIFLSLDVFEELRC
jgi:hypothetical protein